MDEQEVVSHQNRMIGFFEEDHESRSMMRLMCFSAFWTAVAVGIGTMVVAAMKMDLAAQYGWMLCVTFLSTAFGGKIIQKFAEPK